MSGSHPQTPGWTPPGLPDVQGGTHPPAPETYRSPVLRAHGEAIAQQTTRLFYATWPELLARYGERGRQFSYQDNYWHLSTLDAAMRLDSPAMWSEYLQWCRTFFASRGMGDDIVCANFVFFERLVRALALPPEEEAERERILGYLAAAIGLFPEAARTPPRP